MQNNDRRTHKCECRWMDGNQWQWDLFLAFSLVVLVNPVTKLAATHTVANKGNPLHVFRPFIKSAFFFGNVFLLWHSSHPKMFCTWWRVSFDLLVLPFLWFRCRHCLFHCPAHRIWLGFSSLSMSFAHPGQWQMKNQHLTYVRVKQIA